MLIKAPKRGRAPTQRTLAVFPKSCTLKEWIDIVAICQHGPTSRMKLKIIEPMVTKFGNHNEHDYSSENRQRSKNTP